ncbi:MAG TPA: hypothetical protein DCG49_13070 [Ruminococcus sp.]|nr:hypothetical protein [Ruminococcus sp.]
MFRTKRFVLLVILLLAAAVLAVCRGFYRSRFSPESVSEPIAVTTHAAAETAVTADYANSQTAETTAGTVTGTDTPQITQTRYEQIREHMELLQKSCSDFIGWLYIPDSEMNLPVVQGSDNDYYLSHAPDGTYYREGTIFLDYRSSPDLSDLHNILYGHNMMSGMFGDIRSYKDRAAFDRHLCGWFLTPDQTYRIDFFALSVVSTYDVIYETDAAHADWLACILENAMHLSEPLPEETDRLITLSTCSSEFANARALFTGKLVPIEKEDEVISQINEKGQPSQ